MLQNNNGTFVGAHDSQKKDMRIYFSFLMLLFSYSVTAQRVQEKTITISPFKKLENYEHFKRLVMHTGEAYINHIDGFEFEWGYTYELKVNETRLEPRLSDGTSARYTLKAIISKTPVNDSLTFRLFLSPDKYYHPSNYSDPADNSAFQKISERVYRYHDEVEIEIPEELETEFIHFLSSTQTRQGEFYYQGPNRIRIRSLE